MKRTAFGTALFLFISLLIQHGSIGAMAPSQGQIIPFNASQPAITCSMYSLEYRQAQTIQIRPAAIETAPLKNTSYSCNECPKTFRWQKDLIMHNRTHTGEKPFICDLCPTRFAQQSNLTAHKKRIHLGEKSHSCKECNASFFQKKDLIIHNMIHTGEKPFTCKECPKSFKRNEQLTLHKRVHNKEKPYLCDMCPKSFSQSGNLAMHKNTHTKEKSFACTLCNKSYDDQSNYNRHMKSKTHEEKCLENEDPETRDLYQELIKISKVEDINNKNMLTTQQNRKAIFPTIIYNEPISEVAFFQLDL
jgi:uncharacterized Zn-finger protein